MTILPPNANNARVISANTWSGDPGRNPPPIKYSDQLGAEARRGEIEQTRSSFATVNRVAGRIKIAGVGELLVPITFPVYFIEWPSFSQGFELDAATPLETGNFPSATATACEWQIVTAGQIGEYWRGVSLAMIITGNADQIGYMHWQFEAKAINDLGSPPEAEDDDG